MRILHTADWHLNDRLGRMGRQEDIVARLEEIAGYLDKHRVDVMVVAGDLFSQHTRMEELKNAVGEVNRVFKPFLAGGGTIVSVSGNHDNEALFNLLRFALDLAHPLDPQDTGPRPSGRLYLAASPTRLLLEDAEGQQVQFVLAPYPTPVRYLRGEATGYASLEEKNRSMHQALLRELNYIKERVVDSTLPSVLVSHIHVRGSQVHNLYRITELEDVVFDPADIPTHWQYVAYGHIHKPQALPGADHVRYAGSIERFDYGERDDEKSVTLVEIGSSGMVGEPVILPLDATPIYRIEIDDPDEELSRLKERYPDHERALVSYQLHYDPTRHNRDAICREIESVFPRWYDRKFVLEGSAEILESAGPEVQTRDVLQKRLLLCLYGLGTNVGLKRVAAGDAGSTYSDLRYVRRRFVHKEQLRAAIARVADGVFAARDPGLWGEATTACASDSKKFGAWDQNLMTEWHIRYGGRGVMIYWHVEKKSVCIYSQLKRASSSEVAAMIEGVLRHCTEMSVDRNYVDTHGQSEVAFAFSHLLGFRLLPRLKNLASHASTGRARASWAGGRTCSRF